MEPLSLTGKRWNLRMTETVPAGDAAASSRHLTGLLFMHRGVIDAPGMIATPGLDAALFPDCEAAAQRIRRAVGSKETVAIFGDYDCDGVTSTALMARYFGRRGMHPVLRLPHRLHEGYGLKPGIVDELRNAGATLLITVDTGISAVAEVERANAAGMDVIILDHHHLPPELPSALAILHPAVAGIREPHPAAAGIAWSVVRFLERQEGNETWEGWDTDCALGAIGTIADLVTLRGSNRLLVQAGLRALERIEAGPLRMLRMQAGLEGGVTSRDVAFRIAPRLNAAGRMADPSIALHALLGDEASAIALEELNMQRQALVGHLFEGALVTGEKDPLPFLCLRSPGYVPGICGLIAGKLTEKLGKPSLVAHDPGDTCVASLRSIPPYNVTRGLTLAHDLLLSFGGHAMAAGCSFAAKNFEELRHRLAADVAATVRPDDLRPSLDADLCVEARHLSLELWQLLRSLEPHGQGNPEPSFLLRDVSLRNARGVGKGAAHLQGFVEDKKLIGFNLGQFAGVTGSSRVDVVCRLGMDAWNGNRSVQLMADDIRLGNSK